jgi:flavin-dependent dehydrogenase
MDRKTYYVGWDKLSLELKAEVVVVGGGAIGLIAAKTLVENSLETILVEEHEEIGVPEHCAGLFNIVNFKRLGLPISEKYIENTVRGAVFHSPTGRKIKLDAGRRVAIVASRRSLDSFLAGEFERKGGNLILGDRVVDATIVDNVVRVKTRRGLEVKAEMLVDAEGMTSILLRRILKKTTERGMWIPIIQLWVKDHSLDPQYVYLFFEEYLPEFFAYLIPINDEVGKLGVASKNNLRIKLNKFIKDRFPGVKIIRSVSHAVYTGRPLKLDLNSKIIPVGDAAGHVKASTGGGVIMGGLIARSICRIIASKLTGACTDINNDKEVVKSLTKELDRIANVMKILRSLPVLFIDRLFEIIDKSGLVEEFPEKLDMDFQYTSILRFLINPNKIARLLLASLT